MNKEEALQKRNKGKKFSEKLGKKSSRIEFNTKKRVLILSEDSGSFLEYFYDLKDLAVVKFDVKVESYNGGTLISGTTELAKW